MATRWTWWSSSVRAPCSTCSTSPGRWPTTPAVGPASWRTILSLADGAGLRYAGQPFVVSDGADVTRTLSIDVAGSARLRLRETLVLGRAGQAGGRVRSRSALRVGGVEAWREDTDLDPAGIRDLPGLLGGHRVVDTVLTLGQPAPAAPPAVAYTLPGAVGTVTRYLGTELADSPLSRALLAPVAP